MSNLNYLVTADCHGNFSRFEHMDLSSDMAVIILGDAGLNFWQDRRDQYLKDKVNKFGSLFYCLRGNHEIRPQNIFGMTKKWDNNVSGFVYYQEKWPNIRYFLDYGIYSIDNHRVAVIGGAYSVDKYYRLQKKIPWFADEQLTKEEMQECQRQLQVNNKIDIMLTHTCPISWEPRDLFLPQVDQSSVDKSMELFLEDIKRQIEWKIWLFGHYHQDRLERPRVQQLFKDVVELDTIWNRWCGNRTIKQEWYLTKGPNYYMRDE